MFHFRTVIEHFRSLKFLPHVVYNIRKTVLEPLISLKIVGRGGLATELKTEVKNAVKETIEGLKGEIAQTIKNELQSQHER